ncbi:MAG: hypothetical protein JSS32_05440 [Verrucomicrobia bacterium]|nr:hypothetical protein [Verrucomicrobiota bacterium]
MSVAPVKRCSKCCTCNAPLIVGIVATAIAIAGLVAAIFLGQIWLAVGFALLGGMSIYLGIQGSANDMALKQAADRLRQADQAFQRQISTLNNDISTLQHLLDEANLEEERLQTDLQQWNRRSQELTSQIQTLGSQNRALEQSIVSLKGESAGLQKEIQQFLTHTLEWGKTTGAFQQAGTDLSTTQTKLQQMIQSLNEEFQGDIGTLSQHLQAGKEASQAIFQQLTEQQQKQKTELSDLQQVNQGLHSSETALAAERGKLETQSAALQKRAELLDSIEKRLAEEEAKLSQQKQSLQDQLAKMHEVGQTIHQETASLHSAQSELQGAGSLSSQAIGALGDTLHARQEQLKTIDALIRQRLAELKTLNAEIAQKRELAATKL